MILVLQEQNLALQEEILTLRKENEELLERFTAVTTELRTLRERLIRQRWSIENEWHWARDVQLGEDAHRRTVAMNLLRRAGYRSIRQGLRELAYDIRWMLALNEALDKSLVPAHNTLGERQIIKV